MNPSKGAKAQRDGLAPPGYLGDDAKTGGLAQGFGAIGEFPGKARAGASKVPVGRGELVDRPAKVESFNDLLDIVGKKKAGDEVDLEIIRNGESLKIPQYASGT